MSVRDITCILAACLAGSSLAVGTEDGENSRAQFPEWPEGADRATVWKPPGAGEFDQAVARRAIFPGFFYGMWGDTSAAHERIEQKAHVAGWVKFEGRFEDGPNVRSYECAVAIVCVAEKEALRDETEFGWHLALLRGRAKIWERAIGGAVAADATGLAAPKFALSLAPTKFDLNPLVLLFEDNGMNSRDFSYKLFRVRCEGLEMLWQWSADGHTGSTTQGYSFSNVDFSPMTSGTENAFIVRTTSGNRRKFQDVQTLQQERRKRVFEWDEKLGRYRERGSDES